MSGRPPLALVFSVTVVALLNNALVASSLPEILDAFGVSHGWAGVVVAAGSLPGIIAAPTVGLLADRLGRRRVLVPCLVIFGAFGAVGGLAPALWVLIVARLGQGIGSAGLINLSIVLISDHWDGIERAERIGWNAAVITTSAAIYPALGGGLTDLFGWRWSFVPYLAAFIVAGGVLRWLPDHRPDAVPLTLRDQIRAASLAVRRRELRALMILSYVAFVLIFGIFLTLLPVHLDERFGLRPAARGLVLAAPALTAAIGSLLIGRMRSRIGPGRLIVFGYGCWVVAFATIGLTRSLWVLVVAAVLYGFGDGIAVPTVQDQVAERAPADQRGAVVAVSIGFARGGQASGALLAGAELAIIGAAAGFVVAATATAVLVVWLVSTRALPDREPGPVG